MSALNFPSNPVDGQLFPLTVVRGQPQFRYDASRQVWLKVPAWESSLPVVLQRELQRELPSVDIDASRITSNNLHLDRLSLWTQLGLDFTGDDSFGYSVSISQDGRTIAVGSPGQDEGASGSVDIYRLSALNAWESIGNISFDSQSGYSVSLSTDGNRVAIGAIEADGTGADAGRVGVYEYVNSVWTRLGGFIEGEAAEDYSGISVSLSADGDTVAIGAHLNDGGGNPNAGHVRVYAWNGSLWSLLGSDIDGPEFGRSEVYIVPLVPYGGGVSSSYDQAMLGQSFPHDFIVTNVWVTTLRPVSSSNFILDIVNATDPDNERSIFKDDSKLSIDVGDTSSVLSSTPYSFYSAQTTLEPGDILKFRVDQAGGASYPVVYIEGIRPHTSREDINNNSLEKGTLSGWSVDISAAGNRVAIGAITNEPYRGGFVRVYEYNGTNQEWEKLGGDISGTATGDLFGWSVSLNAAGDTVAIGAIGNDENGENSGHVKVYRMEGNWVQLGQDLKGIAPYEGFGWSVSLNDAGDLVAIGSAGTETVQEATRVYRYYGVENEWRQVGPDILGEFGSQSDITTQSVALAGDGGSLVVGYPSSNLVRAYMLDRPAYISEQTQGINGQGDYVDGVLLPPVVDVVDGIIDSSLSNFFIETVDGDVSFTFSNNLSVDFAYSFKIEINYQSGVITWPSTVEWSTGFSDAFIRNNAYLRDHSYLFEFYTYDGGSHWNGRFLSEYELLNGPSQNHWLVTLGGSYENFASAIALDTKGNVYVCGTTNSSVAAGEGLVFDDTDILIAKYNTNGVNKWQRILRSSKSNLDDRALSIAADSSGNVYISGLTRPPGESASDCFIAKYDTDGIFLWQRMLRRQSESEYGGDNVFDDGTSGKLTLDNNGNIYVCVYLFDSLSTIGFLVKLNAEGTILWQTGLTSDVAGTNTVGPEAIALDSSGNVYVSSSRGTYYHITKLNTNGTVLWKGAAVSLNNDDNIHFSDSYAIAVDNNGNVYICGRVWINGNSSQKTILVAKYNADGVLVWQKTLGSSSIENKGTSIAVDSSGSVYICGNTSGSPSRTDCLIAKFDTDGGVEWQRTLSGVGAEEGTGITLDGSGNVYICGHTTSSGAGGIFWDNHDGHIWGPGNDFLIVKLSDDGTLTGTYAGITYAESFLVLNDFSLPWTTATNFTSASSSFVVIDPLLVSDTPNPLLTSTTNPIGQYTAGILTPNSQSESLELSSDLDLYVATDGNDSNSGLTENTPFKTLEWAAMVAAKYKANGNTIIIHVAGGTYEGRTCLVANNKFKPVIIHGDGNVVFRSSSGDISPYTGYNGFYTMVVRGSYYLTGITVEVNEPFGTAIAFQNGDWVSGLGDITIRVGNAQGMWGGIEVQTGAQVTNTLLSTSNWGTNRGNWGVYIPNNPALTFESGSGSSMDYAISVNGAGAEAVFMFSNTSINFYNLTFNIAPFLVGSQSHLWIRDVRCNFSGMSQQPAYLVWNKGIFSLHTSNTITPEEDLVLLLTDTTNNNFPGPTGIIYADGAVRFVSTTNGNVTEDTLNQTSTTP